MKVKNLLLMALAAFSLTFAACDGADDVVVDDGTEETPGGEDPTDDPDDGTEEPVEVVFTVSVTDITTNSATVSVTPSDATVTYYFDVIEKTIFDEYDDAQAFATDYIAYIGDQLSELLSQGNDSYSYAGVLTPSTEYYAFAVGVDADGTITTDVTTETFTTEAIVPSDNTFTVTETNGNVEITPSNNDPYVWDIYETSLLEGYADDEIIEAVIYTLGEDLPYYTATGPDSYDYSSVLEEGVSYTVLVFGYDGGATTGLTKYEFTYETAPAADVVVDNITSALFEFWGTAVGADSNEWYLTLNNADGYLSLDFFTDSAAGLNPIGTYTLDSDNSSAPGTASTRFSYYGVGYFESHPLTEGSFSIEADGDNYKISVNVKDRDGKSYACDYSGPVALEDYTAESSLASKKAARLELLKANRRTVVKTLDVPEVENAKIMKLSSVLR